jgi:hypothetical protein
MALEEPAEQPVHDEELADDVDEACLGRTHAASIPSRSP